MQFLKTTIVGGVIFLVPIVFLLFILDEAIEIMLVVAEPLADYVPVESVAGVTTANIIAVLTILLVCFFAGLAARTRPVQLVADKLEHAVLSKVPGYAMIKSMAGNLDARQQADMKPVLVDLGQRARVGLEVERVDENRVAVYFPDAPNAWSGTVEIVASDQVQRLNVSFTDVLTHVELLGKHSADLLARS